jgi:precorrin-4 methylase
MGVGQIEQIAAQLLAAGRGGETPAAAIQWGATQEQKVVRATLQTIAQAIAVAGLDAPAVIVIGEVAALHDELAWFHPEPSAVFWPHLTQIVPADKDLLAFHHALTPLTIDH